MHGEHNHDESVQPSTIRTFRDLVAWQRAMKLARLTYDLTASMPDSERFGLVAQMRRAAVSIPSNIAEGHSRQSRGDYVRFLRMARGSLAELDTQAQLATDLGLIAPAPQLDGLIREVSVILQSLIRALVRK